MRFFLIFLPLVPVVAGIWFIFVAGMRFQACKKHALPYAGFGVIFILSGMILFSIDVLIVGIHRMPQEDTREYIYQPPRDAPRTPAKIFRA